MSAPLPAAPPRVAPLLVELFTEELPPKALKALGEAFAERLVEGLERAGLRGKGSARARVFATPRRLGALIPDVRDRAEDRAVSRKLMPAKVAYGAGGAPTEALRKRLEKEGVSPAAAQLASRTEQGQELVYLERILAGVALAQGLQAALKDAIEKLPIPKVMSYQLADGDTTVRFVRPVHGVVALHGEAVVPVEALGLSAGRVTHGHRFLGMADIPIVTADTYEDALAAHGKVIASFDDRRDRIAKQLSSKARELGASLGSEGHVRPLLDEVSALVEWPTVYAGQFEQAFLAVPPECLALTMRQNQKYFPLFAADGRLTNRFLIVSNMELADPRNVVEGNERVVRPRLADARFFFETDARTRLEARVPQLASIVYHNKLGTQLERVERVQGLAERIARRAGADPLLAARAALLAKADLTTLMVGEFPELQGIMGRYYALHDGEPAEVASAIEAHYRPRFAGDTLPASSVAISVALADKLETLAGMFGIGQQPSGDKDPFALRRNALGVVRILIEQKLEMSLHDLVNDAFAVFPQGMGGQAHADLETFIYERLRSYLRDSGYTANEIEAVLSLRPALLNQVPNQLAAVRAFSVLPEAQSLAAANKRVANILKQAEAKGEAFATARAEFLQETAERTLFDALRAVSDRARPLFQQGDYTGYLKAFAILKSPVDAFFDSVMVMVDEPSVRHNRLALLADLRTEMNLVADLSKLAV